MWYVKKDITTVTVGIIAHGVNCQGKMGSGVAKAIRDKWSVVYEYYARNPIGKQMLGVCQIVPIHNSGTLFVANCYTQVFYGFGGRFAKPEAIKTALIHTYYKANDYKIPVYMPKIGAGLGGLNWTNEVEPIVKELDDGWPNVDTYVCVLDEETHDDIIA